jgi:hypothetical protein
VSTNAPELLVVAYHEAGHAAVSVALGRQLEVVEITPGGAEREGMSKEAFPDDEAAALAQMLEYGAGDSTTVHHLIMVALAGRSAEQAAGFDQNDGSDARDAHSAVSLAQSLCGSPEESQNLLDRLLEDTRALLARPAVWAGVQRLVTELLRTGRVAGDEAARILSAN